MRVSDEELRAHLVCYHKNKPDHVPGETVTFLVEQGLIHQTDSGKLYLKHKGYLADKRLNIDPFNL